MTTFPAITVRHEDINIVNPARNTKIAENYTNIKTLKKGFTVFGNVDQNKQDVLFEHGQLVASKLLDSKAHVVVVEPIPSVKAMLFRV